MIFRRRIEVMIDSLKFIYPGLFIDFRTAFDDDPEPNTGEIVIYNVSDESENRIKKGQTIILNAGYEGDVGTIFAGVVEEAYSKWDGPDKQLRIACGDATDRWANATVNKTYVAGTSASQIIRDMLGNFGLEVGQVSLSQDIVYPRARTFSMPLRTALQQLSKDTGSKFHISNGSVVFRAVQGGKETGFILNADSGLIGSPERVTGNDDVDYSLFCFLNHRIHADSIIKIESRTVNGIFRVVKGEHVGNRQDFITRLEVKAA